MDSRGNLEKHKTRLIAKGFEQCPCIDFDETFAPVVKWGSIRLVIAFAAHHEWEISHMDVKTSFLNGDLSEEVYMTQPQKFEEKGKETLVCRLKKSLYGLKQAPRDWY